MQINMEKDKSDWRFLMNQKKYINNYSARDLVELIKENF